MNLTSVDPPEVIRFLKQHYPEVELIKPKASIYKIAVEKTLLPTQRVRWCCEEYKENAGALIDKAGVTVRVRAEVEKKFTDLLVQESSGLERKGIVEKAYVERKDGATTDPDEGGPSTEG